MAWITVKMVVSSGHRSIFHKVLHSTIDFVWSTPVGKIVNRFSKDMDETDIVRNVKLFVGTLKQISN